MGENSQEKILTVLAVDEKDQKAVVTFAKKPFSTDQGQKLLDKCDLKIDLKNDCYHTFGESSNFIDLPNVTYLGSPQVRSDFFLKLT